MPEKGKFREISRNEVPGSNQCSVQLNRLNKSVLRHYSMPNNILAVKGIFETHILVLIQHFSKETKTISNINKQIHMN